MMDNNQMEYSKKIQEMEEQLFVYQNLNEKKDFIIQELQKQIRELIEQNTNVRVTNNVISQKYFNRLWIQKKRI